MSGKLQSASDGDGRIAGYVFRAIADYTYDWESWHAPDGRLLWVNAAVGRMTGYEPDECLQMTDYPLFLVADEDREKIRQVLRDAKAGGSGNDVEFQIKHRDGIVRWAAVSWQPMYDDAKRHLGYRASIRDVTERHILREELRVYNQHLEQLVQERTAKIAQLEEHRLKIEKLAALGQLAAGVAHEVNNPLAGIRNAFALLKGSFSAGDENYELLEMIDNEIERISSITHQMYQLYRPSQQLPVKFDLLRALESVVALLQPLAEELDVHVVVGAAEGVVCGELDVMEVTLQEGECRQIFLNIVRNAIQASPPRGIVTVVLSLTAELVTIVVEDQGEGISDEVAARIFDPFFSTKTGSRSGMGLGLSVSKSLAEASGGRILVESKNTYGTRVSVILPRRIDSDE